ncbi:hypothetical protein TNCV_2064601 [Trichonephila clavipes]|nr:hypothetical protein TNCV_2064601 [Trichonephila clavipes]
MNDSRGDTRRALIGSNVGNPCCLGGYTNPFERDNVGTLSESNSSQWNTKTRGLPIHWTLSLIVTGDETWVSHITPESKQQLMGMATHILSR